MNVIIKALKLIKFPASDVCSCKKLMEVKNYVFDENGSDNGRGVSILIFYFPKLTIS